MQWMKPLIALARRTSRFAKKDQPASTGYGLMKETEARNLDGWRMESVAEDQHRAFAHLLREARAGRPRVDFQVASLALQATQLSDPLVVEVGCGSGYYCEVFSQLLRRPIRYIGIDYSFCMTSLARVSYPAVPFVTANACQLPLQSNCCDILLSGTSLMHVADYQTAIAESMRVSRQWCLFHTVPVMESRSTVLLAKQAYGASVVEVIFNRAELETLFTVQGLEITSTWESLPYDVSHVVGEHTWTLSYLCQKFRG
ncbi:MAG: class I SAM-dependent methyltransferase [Acidobacteria bacterium]|nr:class I SAM-dependent methyltransferase [Acidobacteriota bacterium]MCI0721145.1 class I SAM-dependent methyltransferase [Acidobacteriota bacterium]